MTKNYFNFISKPFQSVANAIQKEVQSVSQNSLDWLKDDVNGEHQIIETGLTQDDLLEGQITVAGVLLGGGLSGQAVAGVLAEEGIADNAKDILRQVKLAQDAFAEIENAFKKSKNNVEDLKNILEENQGAINAIRHTEVILKDELQQVEKEEEKEVDALVRIATTLDKPNDIGDFFTDLSKFDSSKAKVDYVVENFRRFGNLTPLSKSQILEELLESGGLQIMQRGGGGKGDSKRTGSLKKNVFEEEPEQEEVFNPETFIPDPDPEIEEPRPTISQGSFS